MAMTFALGTSAQGVFDVHSHLITSDFLAALKQEDRLMEEGFPLPKYDAEAHLKWMDEAGIQTSVLTLAAPQPGLNATPAERKDIIRQEKLFGLSATDAKPEQQEGPMIVRIAEIEVVPEHLEEYLAIAGEVDRLSMEREPGVICLFPMQSDDAPNRIRILEIYASEEAYQKHLRTEHFQKYKQGTLHMVKDLKLPLMQPLDQETMKLIFKKHRK